MKSGIKVLLSFMQILLLVFVTWNGVSSGALAQETDATSKQQLLESVPADTIGDRAAELVARIRAGIDRSDKLLEKLVAASKEDSLVLELQISKLQLQLLTEVHELADILVKMEGKEPQPELRREVEATFTFASTRIRIHINRLRSEIDEERNKRSSLPAADLPALEDRIAKLTHHLDIVYGLGRIHIEKL